MRKYRAVIDTNVIFSGLYSAAGASYRVLELIEKGTIVPYLSTSLVFEYEDVLKRNKKQLKLSDGDIENILDGICSRGSQRQIHFLWRPLLPDPKDDHVLELAVACNSPDIVTYNVKDFYLSSAFGIRAVKPAQVLEELS